MDFSKDILDIQAKIEIIEENMYTWGLNSISIKNTNQLLEEKISDLKKRQYSNKDLKKRKDELIFLMEKEKDLTVEHYNTMENLRNIHSKLLENTVKQLKVLMIKQNINLYGKDGLLEKDKDGFEKYETK